MTDSHHGHGAHPTFQLYFVVALALAGFTLVSFFANFFVKRGDISVFLAFAIILGVAVFKAMLVGLYYMHLRYDWGKLYFLIIPVFILASMMMIVLMPDIVVAWHHEAQELNLPKVAEHQK